MISSEFFGISNYKTRCLFVSLSTFLLGGFLRVLLCPPNLGVFLSQNRGLEPFGPTRNRRNQARGGGWPISINREKNHLVSTRKGADKSHSATLKLSDEFMNQLNSMKFSDEGLQKLSWT